MLTDLILRILDLKDYQVKTSNPLNPVLHLLFPNGWGVSVIQDRYGLELAVLKQKGRAKINWPIHRDNPIARGGVCPGDVEEIETWIRTVFSWEKGQVFTEEECE